METLETKSESSELSNAALPDDTNVDTGFCIPRDLDISSIYYEAAKRLLPSLFNSERQETIEYGSLSSYSEENAFVEEDDQYNNFHNNYDTTTRLLHATSSPTIAPHNSVPSVTNESEVIAETFLVYGSFFAVSILAFCCLRKCHPRVYNIRSWAPKVKCDLALVVAREYRFFDWIWKIRLPSDDEIREQCGMDGLCLSRMFRFGMKLCLVGMFNSLWLIPVYVTAGRREQREQQEIDLLEADPIQLMTIASIEDSSLLLLATILATYVIWGFAMYFIQQEYTWFKRHRHAYLAARQARNYTIYVSGLPEHLRSDVALQKYFEYVFSKGAVLEAHVGLNIAKLESYVKRRDAAVLKLEHYINIEQVTGITPMTMGIGEQSKLAIPETMKELERLNHKVAHKIHDFEKMWRNLDVGVNDDIVQRNILAAVSRNEESLDEVDEVDEGADGKDNTRESVGSNNKQQSSNDTTDTQQKSSQHLKVPDEEEGYVHFERPPTFQTTGTETEQSQSQHETDDDASSSSSSSEEEEVDGLPSRRRRSSIFSAEFIVQSATSAVKATTNATTSVFLTAEKFALETKTRWIGGQGGSPREAGFVTFKELTAKQAAVQMIHSSDLFSMHAVEAPDPDSLFYGNVGKSSHDLKVGALLSFVATMALRIFWTFPTAFISSLNNITELQKSWPALADAVQQNPWLPEFFKILSPLLLVMLNSCLPTILEWITLLEFPLAKSNCMAQMYPKLCSFMIIQTFFISAISGSIWQELEGLFNNILGKTYEILSTTLPGQSTYFIQILLVKTFSGLAIEMLMIVPLCKATARKFIGPNLTEEESSRPAFGFIRPLCEPRWLLHAEVASANVLYFMVFFVYTANAPLVNWFLFFCFGLLYICWRYQMICNYPIKPDTGGAMFLRFMQIVRSEAIIGQVTLYAILLGKQSILAVPLLIPLLSTNLLFNLYIEQRHTKICENLPSEHAVTIDLKYKSSGEEDFSFVVNQYKQPAMKAEEFRYPDVVFSDRKYRAVLQRIKDKSHIHRNLHSSVFYAIDKDGDDREDMDYPPIEPLEPLEESPTAEEAEGEEENAVRAVSSAVSEMPFDSGPKDVDVDVKSPAPPSRDSARSSTRAPAPANLDLAPESKSSEQEEEHNA